MADMTPEEHEARRGLQALHLEAPQSVVVDLTKLVVAWVEKAEDAAYERAEKACKERGNKIKKLLGANSRISGHMADACDACARDVRTLKHKEG